MKMKEGRTVEALFRKEWCPESAQYFYRVVSFVGFYQKLLLITPEQITVVFYLMLYYSVDY